METKAASREFNFGSGMPDPKTFPNEALAAAAQRAIVREGASLVRYPEQRGYAPLREIAAARFERNHGLRVPLGDVVLTNGSMQAIILATQAYARAGDTVLVEEYCYSGTLGVLRQYGTRVEPVALDEQGLRVDVLDATLERLQREGRRVAFVYTIATHQNPTGSMLPPERRREVLVVCRRRGVLLVEDDCYADVLFEGEAPRAMYAMAAEMGATDAGTSGAGDSGAGDGPGVLYIGSFSKILGPGIRLGYFIAPERIAGKLLAYKRDGGTTALASMVVAEYFKDSLWTHVAEVCDAVRSKRDTLFAALERELGGLVEWSRPHGGLFTWIALPEGIDTRAIAERAKERGILYGSGRSFDAADRDVQYLRLAFGFIDEALIPEGIALLGECIEGAAPGGRT
jgi:2-aminoadipate transaminase